MTTEIISTTLMEFINYCLVCFYGSPDLEVPTQLQWRLIHRKKCEYLWKRSGQQNNIENYRSSKESWTPGNSLRWSPPQMRPDSFQLSTSYTKYSMNGVRSKLLPWSSHCQLPLSFLRQEPARETMDRAFQQGVPQKHLQAFHSIGYANFDCYRE